MKNNFNSANEALNFSHLKQHPQNNREITANVRKELAKYFPGVKFSVRYESFSGGNAIRIKYTDGVPVDQVEKVVAKFEYDSSNSDIMTDYFQYDRTPFIEMFGGAKYVTVSREMSVEVREQLRADIVAEFPQLEGKSITRDDFLRSVDQSQNAADAFRLSHRIHWVSVESMVRALFETKDYSGIAPVIGDTVEYSQGVDRVKAKVIDIFEGGDIRTDRDGVRTYGEYVILHNERTTLPTENAATDKLDAVEVVEGIQIVEYSEKAVAVVGDTKQVKETLRDLGGRFNARLSCGAGWIFPKSKTGAIREALAI